MGDSCFIFPSVSVPTLENRDNASHSYIGGIRITINDWKAFIYSEEAEWSEAA